MRLVCKSLFFLFCIFNLNAGAKKNVVGKQTAGKQAVSKQKNNKPCVECKNRLIKREDDIHKNDLETKIQESIEAEFDANDISFNVPARMKREFEVKKQYVITNLMQKMFRLNTEYVSKSELDRLVKQTFYMLIKHIEYSQMYNWAKEVLADVKSQEKKKTNSSCLNVSNPALKASLLNPPYLKKLRKGTM